MSPNQISNIASSLGIKETEELKQFAIEIQVQALYDIAAFLRKGEKYEKISWEDAAMNIELEAAILGAIITPIRN